MGNGNEDVLEPQTWRQWLRVHIEDERERQRLAAVLSVNPVTLIRWAHNEGSPRPRKLLQLLSAFPDHYDTLLGLIQKEFTNFALENTKNVDVLHEVPSQFYASVLHALTKSIPSLRSWSINKLVLQQSLQQLDPHRLGMIINILICTTPAAGAKVRSLRVMMGQGTYPWLEQWDQWPLFLGIESLCGYVVMNGHSATIHDLNEKHVYYPFRALPAVRSMTAAPIRYSEGTAGCFFVCSTQPHYFSRTRLRLIQNYVELLTLAFEPEEFFPDDRIELHVFPSQDVQEPFFAAFQERVMAIMKEAAARQQPLSNNEAVQQAWRQIEDELLYLTPSDPGS